MNKSAKVNQRKFYSSHGKRLFPHAISLVQGKKMFNRYIDKALFFELHCHIKKKEQKLNKCQAKYWL